MINFILTTLVPFLVVFSILVLVHEFGHFITAKWFGIKVEEFGLGMPPKIFSHKFGGTEFSLNAIPLGGFVRLLGEDGSDNADDRSFASKPYLPRAIVLVAGVTMNILIAWLLFSFLIFTQGIDRHPTLLQVSQVQQNSPASIAGLLENDIIVGINDKKFPTGNDFTQTALASVGRSLSIVVERSLPNEKTPQTVSLIVIPREQTEKEGAIGVSLDLLLLPSGQIGDMLQLDTPVEPGNMLSSAYYGAILNGAVVVNTVQSLGVLFVNLIQATLPKDVAGPIGIMQIVGVHAQFGFLNLMFLVGILSINLAVLNILPIPALDGGRIAVITVEKLVHKKLPPNVEAAIHTSGFLLLLALVIAVSFQDIARILNF